MLSRRAFLHRSGLAGGAALAALAPDGLARARAAAARVVEVTPDEVAADETYWGEIQQAFTLDRTIINLNNGGVCPSPRVVHEALKRYLDISNQAPVYHMWQILEPNIESVRRRLAAAAGCDPEELAITRNASEALQIAQLGIELKAGDEVLTTNQDYGRMLDTWEQRVRRDKIKLTKIAFPVPPDRADLVRRFEQAISPATKVIHFCHITNLTGQIFPVQEICAMARSRGIKTIVDGAHAFAHFPFTLADLECGYYGTSLHKWLLAPVGTGFLYVRRPLIKSLWPLTPAAESQTKDIRKFEEIGTHPAANHNAFAEALSFHEAVGGERKAARLRYLTRRWVDPLRPIPHVRILTNLAPAHS
ncbi:MAG: aminotransferase class V-fold PLP-dependent enzyme, partial [Vicinamibacterales bacterium]